MLSLLLLVFIFQVFVYLVNTVGATATTELLWLFYIKLPTPTSKAAKDTAKQRYEVLRLKKEMSAVSAQDDFAKWAKLRRQHDKASETYEKSSSSLQSHKSTFTSTASTVRFFLVHGLRFILQWWYARSPMFWIPVGWVPYYVEWILSFPRAPVGAVSVQIWGIACASALSLIGEAVGAAWKLGTGEGSIQQSKQEKEKVRGEKIGFAADGRSTNRSGTPDGVKKEL